jgi:ATP-dependent protease ClpP protease subunit
MNLPRRTIAQRSDLLGDLHKYGVNLDSREIVLQSNPDGEDGLDYVSANTFIKNLLFLNNLNHFPIVIHQCTVGGEWNYGISIFDAINASPSPTILIAYGHARSMSSIIPQAAKKRIIMPNCDFMIHFGGCGFEGDARSFVAEGLKADEIDRRMIDIYSARCVRGPFFKKYSRERVRKYLREQMNIKREWYMSPTEAVHMGFMDGIYGTPGYRSIKEILQKK